MIGIPIGLLLVNAAEWVVHKHLLHGVGRNKDSRWSFHWHGHHRNSRRGGMIDESYQKLPTAEWNGQTKELAGLVSAGLLTLPLAPIAPFYTATVIYCLGEYYYKHRRSHRDLQWAKEHLPWHYDHHMGPNQHANWCVVRPWMDHLMGTREPYLGTEREARDIERRAKRAERNGTAPSRAAA